MASNELKQSDDEATSEVASSEAPESSVSSWLTGWYDTAKQKLAETNEFMKHDIKEFTDAMQHDASKLVAATANTMKEKLNINVDLEEASAATRVVKDSLSSFLGTIASKVGPQRPDDQDIDNETAFVGTSAGTKVMSPAEARIYAIQTDPATFCNEPDSEHEFHAWLPDFNLEDRKSEISSLMLDCQHIRSLYTKLVPGAVTHCDFWSRYFFKIHQHEKAEERRALLVERAHKAHDDIEWEDDEDDDWVQTENSNLLAPDTSEQTADKELSIDQLHEKSETITLDEEPIGINQHEQVERKTIETVTESASDKNSRVELEIAESDAGKDSAQEETADTSASGTTTDDSLLPASISTPGDQIEVSTAESEKTHEQCNSVNKAEEIVEPSAQPTIDVQPANAETVSTTVVNDATPNKTPSSGESSDDWEKDFDLDMTEDEIQQALKESEEVDVGEIDDDWENWE